VGQQGSYLLPPSKKIGDNVTKKIKFGSLMLPEIWSMQYIDQFKDTLAMSEAVEEPDPLSLRLGPNIMLTQSQVMAAIHAPDTDPIIRDALIAYAAKMRVTVREPDAIEVSRIYGYKAVRPNK
jgi:hypothetical protein